MLDVDLVQNPGHPLASFVSAKHTPKRQLNGEPIRP
jgi:hypothetical protein